MSDVTAARSAALTSPLLIALTIGLVVMALGGLLTDAGPWFQSLQKPEWQPPRWIFLPAWTMILALAVASFTIAWERAGSRTARLGLATLFGINAMLNLGWNVFYFQLQRPDYALAEIALLWISIAALIAGLRVHSMLAALLLTPYFAWVTFAAMLNFEIVRLNGPFPF
jgi:translocator protein